MPDNYEWHITAKLKSTGGKTVRKAATVAPSKYFQHALCDIARACVVLDDNIDPLDVLVAIAYEMAEAGEDENERAAMRLVWEVASIFRQDGGGGADAMRQIMRGVLARE